LYLFYIQLEAPKMATLIVSHYIYLNREQRYGLHEGKPQEVVGVAIPVWFNKGNTSEPAAEVFCRYTLSNDRQGVHIHKNEEGFKINLPNLQELNGVDVPVDSMLKKTIQQRLGTSDMLLDLDDGGQEACEFKFYEKLLIGSENHHLVHFVEIKPEAILIDTLG